MTTLAVGNGPFGIALSPDNATLYVVNQADGTVSVVDTATFTVTNLITVGSGLNGACALSPDGATLFVCGSSDLYAIDTGTAVVSTVSGLLSATSTLVFSPDGSVLYAGSGFAGGAIYLIDPVGLSASSDIAIGGGPPESIDITPDGLTIYAVSSSLDILVVDIGSATVTNTFSSEFDGFGCPSCAVSPDGTQVLFCNYGSSTSAVLALDIAGSTFAAMVPNAAPYFYFFVGYSPDGTIGITVDFVNAVTFFFDPSTDGITTATPTLGGGDDGPVWAAMSTDNLKLYTPLQAQNEVVKTDFSAPTIVPLTGESDWSIDWADETLTLFPSVPLSAESDWTVDWTDATLDVIPLVALSGESDWTVDWAASHLTVLTILPLTGSSSWTVDWAAAVITAPIHLHFTGESDWSIDFAAAELVGPRRKIEQAIQFPTPAALKSSEHTRIVKVEVWHNDTFVADLPVTAGSITVDQTATIRRTCTLTVVDKGIHPGLPSLVPKNPTDLLHPLSGNELHVFRGFRYDDGEEVLYPLGVFGLTKPVLDDTGDAVTITVNGNDRSAWISKTKWTDPYQVTAGADMARTVIAVLHDRWPAQIPLDMSRIDPTDPIGHGSYGAGQTMKVPTTTWGADPSGTNNPFADLQTLVMAAGMELFFDVIGRPVLQSILQPQLAGVVPIMQTLYEDDSPNDNLTRAGNTLDETASYSGVVAIGNGSGTDPNGVAVPPVTSKSISPTDGLTYTGFWNTDPSKTTYFDPGNPKASAIGPVPYIFTTQAIPGDGDTEATAQVKINAAAKAQLQFITTAFLNPTFECIPNPALQENDLVTLVRARSGLAGNFIVQGMTIPLDVTSTMQVTLKPQEQVGV